MVDRTGDLYAAATTTRLEALVAVADEGSVRGAAEVLHVTSPAVSASVAALEAGFGVDLVTREGRGVRLTRAGEVVVDYARTVLGLLGEARAVVRGAEHAPLRLGAVATAAEAVLPPVMASFLAGSPGSTLSLDVGPRDVLFARARHHELDLVVAGRPPASTGLVGQAHRPNTLVVVGAPGVAGDLERTVWLVREPGSGTRDATVGLFDRLGIAPRTMELTTQAATIAACRAGIGITLVHTDAAAGPVRDVALEVVPVPGTPIDRPWVISTNPRPTPAAAAFIRHAVSAAGAGTFTARPR